MGIGIITKGLMALSIGFGGLPKPSDGPALIFFRSIAQSAVVIYYKLNLASPEPENDALIEKVEILEN